MLDPKRPSVTPAVQIVAMVCITRHGYHRDSIGNIVRAGICCMTRRCSSRSTLR